METIFEDIYQIWKDGADQKFISAEELAKMRAPLPADEEQLKQKVIGHLRTIETFGPEEFAIAFLDGEQFGALLESLINLSCDVGGFDFGNHHYEYTA